MSGLANGLPIRLGRREWVDREAEGKSAFGPAIWLRIGTGKPRPFRFEDTLRADARDTIETLNAAGSGQPAQPGAAAPAM